MFRGACGVMVIVIGNRDIDPSSNHRWSLLYFTELISLGKVWILLFSVQLYIRSREAWAP